MSRSYYLFGGGGSGGVTDPETVRDTIAAALRAGQNINIVSDDVADTITITANMDPEVIRDTIGSALVAGSGIGIVVDDANNTITWTNNGTLTQFSVDIDPPDATGTLTANTVVSTAIASVNSLYSTTRGAHTVSLRFRPGTYRLTQENIMDPLTISTGLRRGLNIGGPIGSGKRSVLLIWDTAVTASTDQTKGALFTLVNQRQFRFHDIGFQSNNANQSLFYLWCSVGSDGIYPEFPTGAQNSANWTDIYVDGAWRNVWGVDGNIRANLNSEMSFERWTFSNSLSVTDQVFRWGFPLRDAVFLSTGISAPSVGTFTLSYLGQTTGSLAYNASAASIQTALEGLSTIGTGNVTVTASSTPTAGSYVILFKNAMAGNFDGTQFTTTTSGWSGVSWKVFLYPPQQGQFLNYAFGNNEFEYAQGNLFGMFRGGCITFYGYHSVIVGIGGGTNGGIMFYAPEIATHPDDCCKLNVGGTFRAECRTQYATVVDMAWHGVNKVISFDMLTVSINAISGGATGGTVRAMPIMRFRNGVDAQMPFIKIRGTDLPGYILIENTGTGATGGRLMLEQVRLKSWTSTGTPAHGAVLFASTALAQADTAAAIRVVGSARGNHVNVTTNGAVDYTDGNWSV